VKRDYALTFAAELTVLGAGLLVFKIAAGYWAPPQFSEYVLARRVLALIQGSVALGLSVSLPRHIAAVRATDPAAHQPARFLASAIVLALFVLAAVAAVFAGLPGPLALLLFGEQGYVSLLLPIYLCLGGAILHLVAYGYFRGHLNMVAANALQIVNQGLMHLAPFALAGLNARQVFTDIGIGWIFTSGLTLGTVLVRDATPGLFSVRSLREHGRDLLRFGAPRMPGDITLTVLFNLPASLAAHLGSIVQAGYVAFSLSALSMVGGVFAPIGLVLLPDATRMVARGEKDRLARGMVRLLAVGIGLTAGGILVVELAATPLISWYLGPAYAPAATVLRLVLIGAVPYVCYVLVRSALDALSVKAFATRNLIAGLLVFAAIAAGLHSVNGLAIALSVAFTVTGLLSVWDTRRLLQQRQPVTASPGPGGS
jgi:O-antigen/teichoic acid export membrane protein